ncbi:hypothetical protein BDW74DRAFT_176619 [Aspergillus multicolor]|uniref:uncharacterized protein n=1 Tax=Aspergillus multicolor TaxID=41759 RepID=UPI003CCDF8E0
MPTLTTLPIELIALILESIPNPSVQNLLTARRLSRRIKGAFERCERLLLGIWFDSRVAECCNLVPETKTTSQDDTEADAERPWAQLHPNNCGPLILALLDISLGPFNPSNLEFLLRLAWPIFYGIYLEETLMPFALRLARAYIRQSRQSNALSLLWDIINGRSPFTWSIAPGRDWYIARLRDYELPSGRSLSRELTRPDRERRVGIYPLGKVFLKLAIETAWGPEGEQDLDVKEVMGWMKDLGNCYVRAPQLLIESAGPVSAWMTVWMPLERGLLDQGVLFRERFLQELQERDNIYDEWKGHDSDNTGSCSDATVCGDPIKWPNIMARPVAAVMRVTSWDRQFREVVVRRPDAESGWVKRASLSRGGPKGDGIWLYSRANKDRVTWEATIAIHKPIEELDPELAAISAALASA